MKVAVATDHGGFPLKSTVIDWGGKSYSLERPVLLPSVGSAADLDALLAV